MVLSPIGSFFILKMQLAPEKQKGAACAAPLLLLDCYRTLVVYIKYMINCLDIVLGKSIYHGISYGLRVLCCKGYETWAGTAHAGS